MFGQFQDPKNVTTSIHVHQKDLTVKKPPADFRQLKESIILTFGYSSFMFIY